MNEKKFQRHVIDILFVLALMALFAISSVMIIAIGASVYRQTVDTMSDNYSLRTSYSYITEKIRRSDTDAGVEIGKIGNSSSLLLRQNIDGISYTTYLYFYEGSLMEMFVRSDMEFSEELGTPIMEIAGLQFISSENKNILNIKITEKDGTRRTLLIKLRSDIYTEENG